MSASVLLNFLSQDFSRADLIALAALAVAGLSVIYAKRQSEEARRSRLSGQKEARRPQRLEACRAMQDYSRFCGMYYTRYLSGDTNGTRELAARIDAFKMEMENSAIHDMPEVETEFKALESLGWRLQRHIDRLGIQTTVIQRGTNAKSDEEAVHTLGTEFVKKREDIRTAFAPYLHERPDE